MFNVIRTTSNTPNEKSPYAFPLAAEASKPLQRLRRVNFRNANMFDQVTFGIMQLFDSFQSSRHFAHTTANHRHEAMWLAGYWLSIENGDGVGCIERYVSAAYRISYWLGGLGCIRLTQGLNNIYITVLEDTDIRDLQYGKHVRNLIAYSSAKTPCNTVEPNSVQWMAHDWFNIV